MHSFIANNVQEMLKGIPDADLYFSDLVAHVYLYGMINDSLALAIVKGIANANGQATDLPIVMHIHSPGGNITSGMAIMHAMLASRRPVVAVVDGMAFSMAAFLLVAAKHRVASPHAVVLFHELSAYVGDRNTELNAVAHQSNEEERSLEEMVARHARIAPAALKRLHRRDKLLTAAACLRMGVVDRVMARSPRGATHDSATPKTFYLFCPYDDSGDDGFESRASSAQKTPPYRRFVAETADSVVASVAEFDRFVASVRDDPHPVSIRFNACNNGAGVFAALPWLARVTACPLPVHAVINTSLNIADALAAIACDRRIMYSTGSLLLRRLEALSYGGGEVVDDAVENNAVIAGIVRGVFRAHTRLPVATLDKNTTLLTPRDALRLKVVDEVRQA